MPLIITREDLDRLNHERRIRVNQLVDSHSIYDGFICPDCQRPSEGCTCDDISDENYYSCPHCLLPWEDCDCDDNSIIKE